MLAKVSPESQWGWSEILANKANYYLEMLLWSKTEDAAKKHPQHAPEMWWPDFMKKLTKEKSTDTVAMSVDEIATILTKPRK